MPGPTAEVLNEDVRGLRGDFREIRDDVHRIDVSLARVQTEFGFAKWLLGVLLIATISGIGSGIWWAASITADVRNLNARFDKQDARFDKQDARFDKLEAGLLKLLEQTKGK